MIRLIAWLIITIIIIIPPLNSMFIATMPRVMLLQIPLLLFMGYLAGRWIKVPLGPYNHRGITGLIFFIASIMFWMIPHSLDVAISSNWINQLMHLDLLLAGFLLANSLPLMSFVVKIAASIYVLAMLIAAGIVYAYSMFLICATYTMWQQWATGHYLLWLSGGLFILVLIWGASMLNAKQ